MPHQIHASKKQATYTLPIVLIDEVKAAAHENRETVTALVERALQAELDKSKTGVQSL